MRFPKPPPREKKQPKPIIRRVKVRPVSKKQRAAIKLRTEVTRPQILDEDGDRCRACKRPRTWDRDIQVNEYPPRSRGGDMNNPAHCLAMCATMKGDGCHQKYTAGKLKIRVIDEERGCRAPVEFTEGGRVWVG